MPIAMGVFLLASIVAGCGERDQSTLAPKSDAARDIARLWWVMLVASAVVFGVVLVLILVAVLRRRGPEPGSTVPFTYRSLRIRSPVLDPMMMPTRSGFERYASVRPASAIASRAESTAN